MALSNPLHVHAKVISIILYLLVIPPMFLGQVQLFTWCPKRCVVGHTSKAD
ncbi:hypothetical protein SESBI_19932 [Sesbania bispinosa]|nr:hypothetical protein SESBI_19932 [Sesbania bispinosa]